MMHGKTTLQISENLRRKLKVYASIRDIPYEDLISDLTQVMESLLPFKGFGELTRFFENNLEKFGLSKILKKVGDLGYIAQDSSGNVIKVQLELFAHDYLRHIRKDKPDLIISIISLHEELDGIPVRSIVNLTDLGKIILEKTSPTNTIILIPTSLYNRIKALIEDTSFKDPQDYIVFVLREVVSIHEQRKSEEPFTREDVERVKEKLRALGYL